MKGYRLWCPDPKSPKFVISRDVTFDEMSMLSSKKESSSPCVTDSTQKQVELEFGSSDPSQSGSSVQQIPVDIPESTDEDNPGEEQYSIAMIDQEGIFDHFKDIQILLDMFCLLQKKIDAVVEPSNYSEAISCDDSAKWLIAMNEEIESLHRNGTWVLVKPPSDKRIVGCI